MPTTTTTSPKKTRELWLEQAVRALEKSVLKSTAYSMPDNWKVTCGWAKGSTRFIGQCFPPSHSADGTTTHMFISPVLGADIVVLLATLLHEMGHAAVGCEHKHKAPFREFCKTVGLEGKPTSTHAGAELATTLTKIADRLGDYPHPVLLDVKSRSKANGGWVRYESVGIEGYKVVVSPKSIEDWGAPMDPNGDVMVPDGTADRLRQDGVVDHDDEEERLAA